MFEQWWSEFWFITLSWWKRSDFRAFIKGRVCAINTRNVLLTILILTTELAWNHKQYICKKMFSSYPTKLLQSSMNRSESDLRSCNLSSCKESPGKKGLNGSDIFPGFPTAATAKITFTSILYHAQSSKASNLAGFSVVTWLWQYKAEQRLIPTVNEYGVKFLFTGKNISGYFWCE